MNLLRGVVLRKDVIRMAGRRAYSAGANAKKGSKGGVASDAPKASTLSKEVKFGANILKDGADAKILSDSEYTDRFWHLPRKRPALSELKRENLEYIYGRFVEKDIRARIKANNSEKTMK